MYKCILDYLTGHHKKLTKTMNTQSLKTNTDNVKYYLNIIHIYIKKMHYSDYL